MDANECKPRRRRSPVPELEPAYGELRHDYDHRRVQAELFRMVYFHASAADIAEYLTDMHAVWLGSEDAAGVSREDIRRRTLIINDLCRLMSAVGKNGKT